MKIKKQELIEIIELSPGEHYGLDIAPPRLVKVQDLPIIDLGKYQYENYVWLNLDNNKFYTYSVKRSGSYFEDYHWEYSEDSEDYVELQEVELVPVNGFVWKKVG